MTIWRASSYPISDLSNVAFSMRLAELAGSLPFSVVLGEIQGTPRTVLECPPQVRGIPPMPRVLL